MSDYIFNHRKSQLFIDYLSVYIQENMLLILYIRELVQFSEWFETILR